MIKKGERDREKEGEEGDARTSKSPAVRRRSKTNDKSKKGRKNNKSQRRIITFGGKKYDFVQRKKK